MKERESRANAPDDRLRLAVERLFERSRQTRFICIGTVDGHLVHFRSRDPHVGADRIAAISSSVLALNETFGKESLASGAIYSLVVTHHGAVVTVRVASGSRRYALSLAADASETVALALRNALDAAEAVAPLLS